MERLSHHAIPQEADPQPDRAEHLAQLPMLWELIYGDHPGFIALFSGTRADRRLHQSREAFFRYPADLLAATAWVQVEVERDRELYHCSHLLVRPRRRKADAAPLAALYADVDTGKLESLPLEPSAVVESSPGRLQAYWCLTEPIAPAAGEALNRRLAHAIGADHSGWDLTQLLRLPGTRNHKYADAPLVRLLQLSEERVDPAMVARQLPQLPEQSQEHPQVHPVPEASTAGVGSGTPVRLSARAQTIWQGLDVKRTEAGTVDRSASLIRIARVLYEAGVDGAGLAAALAERDASLGWQKYTGRSDAERQYWAIVDLVRRDGRTRPW